jgi:hypothetical protein
MKRKETQRERDREGRRRRGIGERRGGEGNNKLSAFVPCILIKIEEVNREFFY